MLNVYTFVIAHQWHTSQGLKTLTLQNYKAVSGTNNLVKQNWLFPKN